MDEKIWNDWLENPASKIFFKYLEDLNESTASLLAERLMSGSIVEREEQIQIVAECSTLQGMTAIEFEEIQSFYTEES